MKDESNNLHHIDNNDCTNEVQSTMQMTVQVNNLISKKQSTIDKTIVPDNESREEQKNDSNLDCTKSLVLEKEDVPKKTIVRTRRSESMNSSIKLIQKGETCIGVHSKQPIRRKKGRKSKVEKMKEASLYLGLNKKRQKDLVDKRTSNNQYKKRHCLRTIWMNSKSNVTNNAVISSKPQVEEAVKGQVVVDVPSNEFYDKNDKNVAVSNDSTIEIEINDKDSEAVEDSLEKKEDNSMKSKAISVIVKQEKGETEGVFSEHTRKSNQLVWIPNNMLIQEQENLINNQSQKVQQNTEHSNLLLEEETKQTKSRRSNFTTQCDITKRCNVSTNVDCKDLRPKAFTEQNRVTVIKSSQINEDTVPKETHKDNAVLCVTSNATNQIIKDGSESDDADLSLSQRLSRDSKVSGNKSRDRSFGKISELISDEQKQAIETYYTVDMSIVNSDEVQKNLTIIDKKNIRCNICGTFYLRIDKCQVHIWGHLQMKPYQCKACDFATVTVSNVRCHIRKSHLKIKPFACHLCERRYVTAVLLEEHINTHTGARPFKCKLCDFASASRQMLSYHNTTHKPTKDINCKICNKEFYSRGRLRAHMIIHNKDKVVMCKLCSAYLSNAEALEMHHRNVHMQDYICNMCGKRVKSRKALHNHQNVHAAAKYKCSRCPNVYKSSQILKEHLLKHEGIRKYKCNVCEKSFGQQSHLAAHMAVHSKIRFHCPACDKPFNRHDNMKIHTKRCKLFLANPDLKNRITKKERNVSFSKITELNEDSTSGDISNSATLVEDQNLETLMKTVDEKEKTGTNLCKLGLNISCIKSTNKTWSHDDVYKEVGEITGSAKINLIQITKVNDNLIQESENLIIRENILGPESF